MKNSEAKECEFTIAQMFKMTPEQLYQMMFKKSKIIREMMEFHGHRQAIKIIKRK